MTPLFKILAAPLALGIIAWIPSPVTVYTAEMSSTAAVGSPSISYTETATITAYSSLDSCHHAGCVMANGKPAAVGFAACPRRLPLGSKVVISGSIYECGDRTAERFDGRYDLFLGYGDEAHARALEFGKKEMSVAILQ